MSRSKRTEKLVGSGMTQYRTTTETFVVKTADDMAGYFDWVHEPHRHLSTSI